MHHTNTQSRVGGTPGFTLVELLVAMALGLILALAVSSVYLFTKTAFSRQGQLAALQQDVRAAFEFLASDARMVGHVGCYTGHSTPPPNNLSATSIATNYAVGVEGYEYNTASNAYTLGSNNPANTSTASNWKTNIDGNGIVTIPVTTIDSTGLTPGSDVLVIRSVVGSPLRLRTDAAASATTLSVERVDGGLCSNGSTAKISGFCALSHALVASCTSAKVFAVSTVTASASAATVNVGGGGNIGPVPFVATQSEVFPMQTIVYYVARASSGTSTSLWRRIFNGDPAAGVAQELIEGVESLQLRYGRDTTAPDPDGIVDNYVTAELVNDWSRVVAVRMSLLLRPTDQMPADLAAAAPASAPVNDVAITYPSTGAKYDRRVFTTTVALRNKIAYLF